MTGSLKRAFEALQAKGTLPVHQSGSSAEGGGHPKRRATINAATENRSVSRVLGDALIFETDASIVLLGLRGSGKSTLAVFAAGEYGKRIIELEDEFQEATGFSPAQYRKRFGAANHTLRQEDILRNTLRAHDKGAVIVCDANALEGNGQELLTLFSTTHPVIYVMRELSDLHDYMDLMSMSALENLASLGAPLFRECSNFEFYNLTESQTLPIGPENQKSVPAFMTLKRAGETFVEFLKELQDDDFSLRMQPNTSSSSNTFELKSHTCAVQVPVSLLSQGVADIEGFALGADFIEILLDPLKSDFNHGRLSNETADKISQAYFRVRNSTTLPIIYHVMRRSDTISLDYYKDCIHHGARLAPEFLTVDLSIPKEHIADFVRQSRSTKVIGHMHTNYDWHNSYWTKTYDTAVQMGCHALRLTRPALCMGDNIAVEAFRHTARQRQHQIPLICFNTGPLGRKSAVSNTSLTSVIPQSMRESADLELLYEKNSEVSYLTAQEFTHSLYESFTLNKMRFYILAGSEGDTLLASMHSAALCAYSIPHQLETVTPRTLEDLQELLREHDVGGVISDCSFAMEIMPLAQFLSFHAREIGAVDILVPSCHLSPGDKFPENLSPWQDCFQQGSVKSVLGQNTAFYAFLLCIPRGLSPANRIGPKTCGLVLGAGAMARAAVAALLSMQVRNIVVQDTFYVDAKKVARDLFKRKLASPTTQPRLHVAKSAADAWLPDLSPPTIILLASTKSNDVPPDVAIPSQWMSSRTGGVVVNVESYEPSFTPPIRDDGVPLWVCFDGLDFFLERGYAQFRNLTGKQAPRAAMRKEVLRIVRKRQSRSTTE
ncbi:hypothetical protein M011DRAFT_467240 [Sporormia fimetaria CBS 119925]|uniref:Quinate repressor protein n=1 Tax=Sporormia fimetaria CBS 119925 TaxID=1340428 RepID=A0A6A6VGH3_9PLEO|nr:hypothetical protein M011DRAFT_467240 [Sporormia fimetaria CBS 119925]